MKIEGVNRLGSAAPSRGARPAAGGFSVGGAPAASGPAPAQSSGVAGVGSIDALIALQEVDGPLERRRRAVRRAGGLLDLLDEVKVRLLSDELTPAVLDRLGRAMREQREGTGDTGLEGVLDEIETRAQVEMAKLEMARAAA
jgi:hypothetical protein